MTDQELYRIQARVAAGRKAGIKRRDAVEAPAVPLEPQTPAPLTRAASKTLAQPRESELQRSCVAYLRARRVTVWEIFKGSARGGSVWATKGIPDLYLPAWGWIELKTSSGAVSVEQYKRHEELRKSGQRIAVITSLAELIEVIL